MYISFNDKWHRWAHCWPRPLTSLLGASLWMIGQAKGIA